MKKFLSLLGFTFFAACATHSAFEHGFHTFQEKPLHRWNIVAPDADILRFDPSGLFEYQGKLLTVSDRKEYNDIYELKKINDGAYRAEIFLKVKLPKDTPEILRHDFEALTFCNDHFYITDEDHWDILDVRLDGKASIHHPDISTTHKKLKMISASGSDNAGLEGIACDGKNHALYLANERQFRMIYSFKLGDWQAQDFFDLPVGWSLPRETEDYKLYPDFADLFFEAPYLYALQRNDRKILKINLAKKKLVAVMDLDFDERDIYDSKEPFGMAEGLVLRERQILIILDNNGAKQKHSDQDISSLLLEFNRPQGF